jgi:hypothetical protein
VQRIVGLPGERIEMRKGVPVINAQPAIKERLGDFASARPGRAATRLRERFADGTTFGQTRAAPSRSRRAAVS